MRSRKPLGPPPAGFSWCPDCQGFRPISEFRLYGRKRRRLTAYCLSHLSLRAAQCYRKHRAGRIEYQKLDRVREAHRQIERARRLRPESKQAERNRTIKRRAEFRAYASRPEVRARRIAQAKERYRTNPIVRLRSIISMSIYHALKGHKGRKSFGHGGILPYSLSELILHLERQFLPGMSWGNYGSKWHIDHIVPLSSFVITGPFCAELTRAFALTNLRPLWAFDNISKHAHREFLL